MSRTPTRTVLALLLAESMETPSAAAAAPTACSGVEMPTPSSFELPSARRACCSARSDVYPDRSSAWSSAAS